MTAPLPIPVGVGLPQLFTGERLDAEVMRRFALRAEELGFSDLWTQEVFLSSGRFLDALESMAYVAALTDRVRLGVSMIVLPRHNPVVLAKRLATIDQLSGGRVTVGLAVGPVRDEFAAVGDLPPSRERFLEAYDLMHTLWQEPRFRHAGESWRVDEGSMEPKPLQPSLPVWFGARHPSALRRAVRLADGWMGAGSSTVEQFAEQSRVVQEALDARERGAAGFTISKRIYIGVDEDEARAARRFESYVAGVYGDDGPPPEVAVVGSASRCQEAICRIHELGAQHLVLTPVFGDAEQLGQLERLAGLVGLGGATTVQGPRGNPAARRTTGRRD